MRKRLYIDLDGTLARFHDELHYLTRMYDKGFFENLRPFQNMVMAVKFFIHCYPDIEVSILSSVVPTEYCCAEKVRWVKRHLPEVHTVILVPEGMEKSDFVPDITRRDILLDDYNHNLESWARAGGRSVKLVNNINNTGKIGRRWKGEMIYHDDAPFTICKQLGDIFQYTQLDFYDVITAGAVV